MMTYMIIIIYIYIYFLQSLQIFFFFESPGLCEGELSGALISAPDIEDAALTTAVSSAMLVATAMLLAVVIN